MDKAVADRGVRTNQVEAPQRVPVTDLHSGDEGIDDPTKDHGAKSGRSAKQTPKHEPAESNDVDPERMGEHEGATEDQVSETPAPAGPAFNDEPKQG